MTDEARDRSWHSTPTASRDVGYGPGLGPNAIGLFMDTMFGRQEPVWSSTIYGPLADGKFVDELISEAGTLGVHLHQVIPSYCFTAFFRHKGPLTTPQEQSSHDDTDRSDRS